MESLIKYQKNLLKLALGIKFRYGYLDFCINQIVFLITEPAGECDFVIYPEGGTALPIQVSWTLADPDTKNKEIKGLLKAADYCKVNEAWIITLDDEEELTIDGVHIQIIPAWKWMLQEK